jgi:hypothetical protein
MGATSSFAGLYHRLKVFPITTSIARRSPRQWNVINAAATRLGGAARPSGRLDRRVQNKHREISRKEELLRGEREMLWTLFVILLVLWLLGLITSYTFGGFVHILLVVALVVLVIQLISGRTAV